MLVSPYSWSVDSLKENHMSIRASKKMMKEMYAQFKIKHHNSTPCLLEMKGTVKVANNNIKRIIDKMIDTYKG